MTIEEIHRNIPSNPMGWDFDVAGRDKKGNLWFQTWGQWFSSGTTELRVELECFLDGVTEEMGGLGKYGHARNAIDLMFNWQEEEEDHGFIWTKESELLIRRACEWKYLAVAGSGSSGKSHPAAGWGLANFYACPIKTKVLLTSTSVSAGCDRVWGSVIDLYNKLPKELEGIGKLNDSKHLIKYMDDDENVKHGTRRGLELVAAEPKQAKEAVAKLIGRKQYHLILIADELPDISPSVNAAFFTNLSRNPRSQMIGLGNPANWFDAMGELCTPKAGVKSVNVWTREWRTVRGWGIHFDDMTSENYVRGKAAVEAAKAGNPGIGEEEIEKIGGVRYHFWRPSYSEIEESRRLDGENSLLFMRMSRGWFATQGASDSIYSSADMMANMVTGKVEWGPVAPVKLLAVDLSFSSGGDRCVGMVFECGLDVSGKPILNWVDDAILQDDATDEDTTRSAQICRQIKEMVVKHGIEHRHVAYDATGAGAPFGDMLVTYLSRDIYPVNFGGKASDRPVSASNRNPSHTRYDNRVSELWYSGVEVLRGKQFANLPASLMSEMCNRTYTTVGQGKILVQSKREIKARGQPSPDEADCLHIGLDLCRERLHFASMERGMMLLPKDDYFKKLRELDIVTRSSAVPEWEAPAA